MSNEIWINVIGGTKVGKTTIAYEIMQALKAAGLTNIVMRDQEELIPEFFAPDKHAGRVKTVVGRNPAIMIRVEQTARNPEM
jgi:molybdopterin-guanine dinucleotide biosynthesis protein